MTQLQVLSQTSSTGSRSLFEKITKPQSLTEQVLSGITVAAAVYTTFRIGEAFSQVVIGNPITRLNNAIGTTLKRGIGL